VELKLAPSPYYLNYPHYRRLEKLGGDGMGVVSRAGDRCVDEAVESRATEQKVGAGRARVRLRMVHG
jgi:hypothetical protein